MDTNWILPLTIVVLVVATFAFKRFTQLGTAKARRMIADGAIVLDVRSSSEFKRDAVPGAVNLPLDSLATAVPGRFPDRNQVFLIHCLSGGRSLMGCRTLKGLGYTQVHNLGSLSHARTVCRKA